MALSPEEHAAVVSRCNRQRRAHEKLTGLQTGPKSAAGKAASAARSLKHGARSAGALEMRRWIASVNRLAKALDRKQLHVKRKASP